MAKPDLTPQQYQALKNVLEGKPSNHGLRGQSAHGGHNSVRHALHRKGYMDFDSDNEDFVTDDGKTAVASYRAT